jgi:ABC-type lipoprotein release transport system permease subunit
MRITGGIERARELYRDARSFIWLEDARRDVQYGCRGLTGQKSFATGVIATLAFGIGATTAVFSVVNGIVLKPLPFAEPDRLVQMYGTPAIRGEAVDRLDDVRSLPVGVRGPDVMTTLPVALLVGVVALAAGLFPARRAANADPMSLLRSD